MSSADSNRVSVRLRAESSYGVLPASPIFRTLRYTSESFKQDTASTQSQEVRADRNISDIVRTGVSASGELGYELSYGAYDDLFAAALGQTAFTAIHTISASTGISASAADNSFNDAVGNPFTLANGYAPGAWIRVTGFTAGAAANNRVWQIVTQTNAKITVSGGTVVTAAASAPITIVRGGRAITGTTLVTFTVEKQFTDLTNDFEYISGLAVDRMTMEINTDGIITGTFAFVGQRVTSGTATLSTGGTPTAASTNPVLNSIDNVQLVMEGGTAFAITGFSLEVANNLRARTQVGTLGAVSMGVGTFNISGSIDVYYTGPGSVAKYLNWTASSIAVVVGEPNSNNAYVFDIPQVRLTDTARNSPGINQDVMTSLSFEAYVHPTLGYMMQIVKFT